MTFSAQQHARHWPLALLLITLIALTGCRGDSNISNALSGGNTQSTNETEQTSASSDDQHEPEQPQQSPINGGSNSPANSQNPAEDTASQPQDALADRSDEAETPLVADPEFVERPTLQWDSPLTREDGSKLFPGEISGYKVYFRLRHQKRFRTIELEGPDANRLKLDDFETGAYEFSVSTLDSEGLESLRSEPVPVDLI